MAVIHLKKGRALAFGTIILFISCFYIGVNVYYAWKNETCSNELGKEFLQELCDLYRKKIIGGSLCSAICLTKTIKYDHCTNYREGKVVIIANAENHKYPLILKSSQHKLKNFDAISFKVDGRLGYPDMDVFRKLIHDSVYLNLGINLTKGIDVIEQVWSMTPLAFMQSMKESPAATHILMDSVWSLLQQEEYLMLRMSQHLPYIPRLHGTCGYMYAVESAPPPQIFYSSVVRGGWTARVKLALAILDVIRALDSDYHEALHLCDVKPENFGMSEVNNRVKLIDTDCVLRDSTLRQIFYNRSCTKDEDCTFFDCKSWCRRKVDKCAKERVNTNLQVTCEHIFMGKYFFVGLLKKPPMRLKEQLNNVLQRCAFPVTYNNYSLVKYYKRKVYWELYRLLQRSIGIGVPMPTDL
ncbi:divergent protein kinase domain 1C-like [Argonauta hians]